MSSLWVGLLSGGGGLLVGHFWGGTIWPWIKERFKDRVAKL